MTDDCSCHSLLDRRRAECFAISSSKNCFDSEPLAVSPNHPLASRRSVSLVDAAKEPFIGSTREDFPGYNIYLDSVLRSGKKQTESDREARQCSQHRLRSRSRHCSKPVLGRSASQFRQSSETIAAHTRTGTLLLRRGLIEQKMEPRYRQILGMREASCCG